MNKEFLKEAGLNDREIEIYLALLRLGLVLVSTLSKETGLHRSNIYDTLEKLQDKGLVSHIVKNNIKYYKATSPERLLDYIDERKENIKKILPELINLTKLPREETKVEVFKGIEGIKTVLKQIIKDRKTYHITGESEKFFDLLGPYATQWLKKAEELKIKGKLVFIEGMKFGLTKYETCKILPEECFSSIETWIWDTKTGYFVMSPPYFVILVDNKDIADSNISQFNFLWKLGRKPTPKEEKEAKALML